MQLTQPPKPNKGDIVYIVSPSAGILPFTQARTQRGIQHLEALGFKVKVAPHADKNNGYISASVDERVADLHTAFADPACSIIMASIGGDHSNQLISHLDYELIRNNPKTFIGYSDNTVLHYALATQAQLQTYYGPCFLNQFGEYPKVIPYTLDHFKKAVLEQQTDLTIEASQQYTDEILDWFSGEDATRPRTQIKNPGYVWWRSGEAKGWALPATIPSINHLLGTAYMPDPTGAILMIDIPEGHTMFEGLSVADMDAWLTDLDNNGVLSKLNGLILSRPYKYTNEMINELRTVVLRLTKAYDYPIITNVNLGHTDPVATIPIGATIRLDPKQPNSLHLTR
jgi:muramoyltetrapeptide carboxypeptidase